MFEYIFGIGDVIPIDLCMAQFWSAWLLAIIISYKVFLGMLFSY